MSLFFAGVDRAMRNQCGPRRDRSDFNGQHLTVGDRQWTANDVSSSLMEINKMLGNMHYIVCWDDAYV